VLNGIGTGDSDTIRNSDVVVMVMVVVVVAVVMAVVVAVLVVVKFFVREKLQQKGFLQCRPASSGQAGCRQHLLHSAVIACLS
jgi:hypothetical protein